MSRVAQNTGFSSLDILQIESTRCHSIDNDLSFSPFDFAKTRQIALSSEPMNLLQSHSLSTLRCFVVIFPLKLPKTYIFILPLI